MREIPHNFTRYTVYSTFFIKGIILVFHQGLNSALSEYEVVCSEAADAGVDIVTKGFSFNWDYIQSCFFALTILTTIGIRRLQRLF